MQGHRLPSFRAAAAREQAPARQLAREGRGKTRLHETSGLDTSLAGGCQSYRFKDLYREWNNV